MINILNLNPSIDYFVTCSEFELNKTNHSDYESVSVGGKGSNVGILLNNLEVNSSMYGFVGGFTGAYVSSELSKYDYIKDKMIDTKELTRINVKLNYQGETEVNGVGKKISKKYIEELEQSLKNLKENDILVMTGRVANGMSFNWYLEMAKLMQSLNVDFVLDINDEVLKDVLAYNPLLLKPNEDEIRNIFNHHGHLNTDDLITYGKAMLDLGAKHVIISLGSDGSMFFFENKIYTSKNLKREVKSTVGAGDSMIAGFLAEYTKSQDALKAYKMAQACGNATAFYEEIAEKDLIESVYKEIEIKEIENEN